MRIVGVIDIRGGCAVHAHGGVRGTYAPVGAVAGVAVDGDAVGLARAYVERLGVRELYVADLDAITSGVGAANSSVLSEVAAIGVPVMVDAGVSAPGDARLVLDAGASAVVVGLETLGSFDALDDICALAGGERIVFSIDLRQGALVAAPNVSAMAPTPEAVAARAAAAGVVGVIVLDLGRVGTGAGVDVDVIRAVRAHAPRVALFVGGGVRGEGDLGALEDVGCDGVLVATALQQGRLRV
jgi:phosphoribosylformimino-5-aminoimidazole carboxamide ribotide isomerase